MAMLECGAPGAYRMSDEFTLAESAAQFLLSSTALRPKIGLVLGSGLGSAADELTSTTCIPYPHIPGFPGSTTPGHAGALVIGEMHGIALATMQGRVHLYEGYSAAQVGFPIRTLGCMGIRAVILTSAAGGINLEYQPGAFVIVSDHINLQGQNPLVGLNEDRFGPRFPDMTCAYWQAYREIAMREAQRLGITAYQGVYAGLTGPSYGTPAEIRFLRTIGADIVGMSLIPEAVVAQHMGVRVLAISCVTNMAAGILDQPLNHEEVLATARRIAAQLKALLREIIPGIAQDLVSG